VASEDIERRSIPWGRRPDQDPRERTSTDRVWRRGEGDVLPEEDDARDVPLTEILGSSEAEPAQADREGA
jgi:hypothetical protein